MTKADKGVAPAAPGAAPVVTPINPTGNVGLVEAPDHALVRSQLSEYIDNTLDAGLRTRIDEHVRTCRSCAAYLRTLDTTVNVLDQLPKPKAPPERVARVIEQARQEAEQARRDAAQPTDA